MSTDDQQLLPVFVPALCATLVNAEDKKGAPLTNEEVLRIRDDAPCIMMTPDVARQLDERRGYLDIDPENCWHDWQLLRRELGRKPDLDPGPKFNQINNSHPQYQATLRAAQASLDWFRQQLPGDGAPRYDASIKTAIEHGDNRAFMWLFKARISDSGFVAEFFEVPEALEQWQVGDRLEIAADAVMDWMINDNGVLYGGYSLRYQRSQLPEDERAQYDSYIGVERYAELEDFGVA